MQRLQMDPSGLAGVDSAQLEEEASNARWNVVSSVIAFGSIIFLLRVAPPAWRFVSKSLF